MGVRPLFWAGGIDRQQAYLRVVGGITPAQRYPGDQKKAPTPATYTAFDVRKVELDAVCAPQGA